MIPLRRAIALLEVSVSGYYKWLLSDKEHKNGVIHSDIEVLIAVKDVIKDSNNTVPGAVRVHHELDKKGFKVSHKRLVEIMRANGIYHKYHRKYVVTTDSNHNLARAENLINLIHLRRMKHGVEILHISPQKKGGSIWLLLLT